MDGACTREGDEQMDAYWTDSANEMIAFLDQTTNASCTS
jgi:hypothetical protein